MTRPEPDDDVLAMRSRDGDPRALAILYRRHASPLLAYLMRMLGERAEAEDVLQETFLRVFEGRGSYRGTGRFRGWLYTVATRRALDRLRKARRRGTLLEVVAADLDRTPSPRPDRDAEQRETLRRVESVLADLSPAYALAFHLRVREEYTYAEIASITGEPEGTLRSRVHHALRRIRAALEDNGTKRNHRQGEPRS